MGSVGPAPSPARKAVTDTDIKNIKDLLSSTNATVLTPSDDGYADTLKRWSAAAEKPAGLSIIPTTAEEVSIAVKYASEHGLDVAVKGGGHSTAGVSSTNGGLLFDLAKMRGVQVVDNQWEANGTKALRVQGGCNWGDVDQESTKHGLATVGGTVADTGVGGLALGGGYGWMTGARGLVIDNMLECTIVLANGEIKKASEKENPDLFWCLQGAGQNFGVVTEFVFKAFEQGEVWGGLLLFPPVPEIVDKLVTALNNMYMPDKNGKTKVNARAAGGLALAKPPPAEGKIMVLIPIVFFGTEEEGKELFKEFYDIGPVMSTMSMLPYPESNKILAPPYGLRSSMKGAAFALPLNQPFVRNVLDEYTKFTSTSEDTSVSLIFWEFFDPTFVTKSEVGSFANRGWHLNGMIMPVWTDPSNDTTCREWARHINQLFKTELERHGEVTGPSEEVTTLRGRRKKATQFYGNYDHYDERSRDIFGENYPELQKLKAKYDPGNVFNKLFAITPEA